MLKKNYDDLLPLFYFTTISLRALLTNTGLFVISDFFLLVIIMFFIHFIYLPHHEDEKLT